MIFTMSAAAAAITVALHGFILADRLNSFYCYLLFCRVALPGIRAADTGLPLLFCSIKIVNIA